MRNRIAFVLLLAISFLSFGFQQQKRKPITLDTEDVPSMASDSSWSELAPSDGDFSVLMPGTPDADAKPVASPYGNLPVHYYAVQWAGRFFSVTYLDSPGVVPSETEHAFDLGRDALLRDQRYSLVSEKKITLGSYPGRELTVLYDKKLKFVRCYLAGNRMYAVVSEELDDKGPSEETKKFFASFKITERKQRG